MLVCSPGGERTLKNAVLVEKGNVYYMREAVFTFDAREKGAFKLLDQRAQRLRHPLKIMRVAYRNKDGDGYTNLEKWLPMRPTLRDAEDEKDETLSAGRLPPGQ